MTKRIFRVLFLAIVLGLSACPTAATQPAPTVIVELTNPPGTEGAPLPEANLPRVKVEEARIAVESGQAIIVDVRSAESFAISHIAGAISIPLNQIEADPASVKLDKKQWIITYCT